MNFTRNGERCRKLGEYIVENNATVRSTAYYFGVSKSTVHKDVTENLRRSDPLLYDKVKKILENNKEVRHLRGGEATRKKYLKIRNGEQYPS
ncbi:MAG: sporulation transcriptional regulator SpoIIID [Clostridia bacterium]|nr:sporulation transcriptional regulator SpoIIID [Clostridia bacterium]